MQFKGLEEATIATIVGVIMQIVKMVIPGWDWETFKWRNLVRLGLCEAVAYGIFAVSCYTVIDIPGLEPMCGAQGAFNAGIAGILAFLVNKYAEEEAIRWIRERMRDIATLLPITAFAILAEIFAVALGWPVVIQVVLALGATVFIYFTGLRIASSYGIFNIRLSTVLFVVLFAATLAVEFPGNPLDLTIIQRSIALILIQVGITVVSLLTQHGIIRKN